MRIISVITAILFLSSCSEKKDKKELLTGMYKLIVAENLDSTGVWREDPWTKGGTGYIVYDGLGHMAVHITRAGYKDYNWLTRTDALIPEKIEARIDSMTVDELKAAVREFAGSYAYAANYTMEDTADVVVHHRLTASTPAEWGTVAPRSFSFSGDTVTLRVLDGNRRLKWLKMHQKMSPSSFNYVACLPPVGNLPVGRYWLGASPGWTENAKFPSVELQKSAKGQRIILQEIEGHKP